VDWGRYLRWRDSDGRPHERFVSNALLAEPVSLYALLAYDGLKIEPDQARALARYLAVAATTERVSVNFAFDAVGLGSNRTEPVSREEFLPGNSLV
jgi:hypothetical protein